MILVADQNFAGHVAVVPPWSLEMFGSRNVEDDVLRVNLLNAAASLDSHVDDNFH